MAKSSWDWNAFRLAVIEAGIRGELTADWRAANPDVEPAHVLMERIAEEKAELIRTKQIRKEKPLPPIATDEVPFDIPSSWVWSRFVGLLRQLSGKIPRGLKTKEILESGLYPVVSQAAEASVGWSNDKSILVDFDLPLVLFGDHSRTVKLIETPFVIGADGLKLLKPHRGIEPEYLFRMLQTFKFDVASYGRHFSQLTAAVFPVPPIREQQEIVRILSALDSGESDGPVHPVVASIQKLEQEFRELADEYESQEKWLTDLRSALLQEAISGQLTADWRTANPDVEPAHVLLERIAEEKAELIRTKQIRKEKPLPPISPDEVPFDIPSSWEWTRIPFMGVMERGVSKHRPRNDEVLYNGGDIPLVQTGEVARSKSKGHVIWEVNDYYNEVGLAQSRLWPAETLCITIAANIAQTGLLSFDACFPDSVVGFNGIDARRELNWFVRSLIEVAQASLERFAPATAQKNINLEILSSLAVPCPPKLELKEIVARLQKQLAQIAELEEGVEQSKEVAQLLMKSKLAEVFEPAMAD